MSHSGDVVVERDVDATDEGDEDLELAASNHRFSIEANPAETFAVGVRPAAASAHWLRP